MQLFANNAESSLASGITDTATSLTLATGEGALFPSPTGGDFFLATLAQLVNGQEVNHEIVKVTARTTDTFTIERGQEGTTARAFSADDIVSLRLTAGSADRGFAGYKTVTGNYSAACPDRVLVDLNSGASVVTMPSTGLYDGALVVVAWARGDGATNVISFNNNGVNINGTSQTVETTLKAGQICFRYCGATIGWVPANG